MKKYLLKLKSLPWKYIVPIVLIIIISLNIWLGCMPVFKGGSYFGATDHWGIEIKFDNATYSGVEQVKKWNYNSHEGYRKVYGFYYVDDNKIKFDGAMGSLGGGETTNISDTYGKSYKDNFARNSVFSIVASKYISQSALSSEYEKIVCVNWSAVFLQIFYAVIMAVCVGYETIIIINYVKNQKNKNLTKSPE